MCKTVLLNVVMAEASRQCAKISGPVIARRSRKTMTRKSVLYRLSKTDNRSSETMAHMAADFTFHHPYEPYEVQKQLMRAVYSCLEDSKVGIFESPTGM